MTTSVTLYCFLCQYRVHRCIIQSATSAPLPNPEAALNGLPDRVLRVLLHYLYGQSLPENITVDALDACRDAVCGVAGFDRFLEMSELYRRNSALCQSESHPWTIVLLLLVVGILAI